MKQHFDVPQDLTELTHLAEDQNNSPNYPQFDCLRTTYLQEDSLGVASQEGEVSPEEEYLEEVEDTQEEEAHQVADSLEEDGDLSQFKHHNCKQGNLLEKHLRSTMETGSIRNSSSINGNYIGGSTTITPS